MRSELALAIEVVQQGLKMAMDLAGGSTVMVKDGRDIVTATDVAVEDLIREGLSAAFPYAVVGEERGGTPPVDGSPYWLIDPICGTRNFASGTPLYCINLALVEDGRVAVAVVGDPSRDEVAYAELGGGAWSRKDGTATRLAVSLSSRTLVVEEGKSAGDVRERAAAFMARVVAADRWDFRSLGSTIAMPYLAAGRISAYAVVFATAVHCAAGSLLVSEAGGVITDISGSPWTLDAESLLFAADADLHADLLAFANPQ